MPTFPSYSGKVPESLNPLNPGHYLLLAYWVFFRPIALNAYFYQAAPALHQQGGIGKFFRTWGVKAYRGLYLMLVAIVVLLTILLGLILGCHNLATAQGHIASVNTIAVVSPTQVISGATANNFKSGTLKIWDLEKGSVIHTLEGHRRGINTIAVSPDQKRLVSGGSYPELMVWDLESGQKLKTLEGHRRWLNDVVILPDGQRAISASEDGTLKIWNLESGKALYTLEGHRNGVKDIALTSNNQQVISASADGTLKVWDIESGQEVKTLEGHQVGVNKVAILPGEKAISGALDGTLKVWDLTSGQELRTLTGHTDSIQDIAVTQDGKLAISGSADRTLKVWDWQTGQALQTLTGHQGWINSVAVTPDGRQVVSASSDHTLKIWDIQSGKELHTLTGHTEWVRMVALTPDGKLAISGSGDAKPKVWDIQSGDEIPLKSAEQTLFLSRIGFYLAAIFAIALGLFLVALILATGVMAYGIAGSIVSILVLSLGGTIVFTSMFVASDVINVNPVFREAFGAIPLNEEWIMAAFGISFGLLFGVAFGLTGRKAIAPIASVALIAIVAVAIGSLESSLLNNDNIITKFRLKNGVKTGLIVGWRFNLLVLIGAVRALFYPLELAWSVGTLKGKGHPVEWDELQIFPLWGSRQYLYRQLKQDEITGLKLVADVARNPFQRWVAVQALHKYLHTSQTPLHLLYKVLTCPELKEYVSPPLTPTDWAVLPSTQKVLLGELDRRWVDCSSDWTNRLVERIIWLKLWVLTWVFRDRRTTPLTQFAGMLYELLDSKTIEAETFNLGDNLGETEKYEKIYARLHDYPGGSEIATSFQVMATCLNYQQLSDLTGVIELVKPLKDIAPENAIRPAAIAALKGFAEIGAEVEKYQNSPEVVENLGYKLGAIARALSKLEQINTELNSNHLPVPEQVILKKIIAQWRPLLTQSLVPTT
jgi:WD40 repeat protein